MSVIGSNILAGASGQGGAYTISRSLRFRSSASAYLNRTPASATNRRTWTWSAWVKRGSLNTNSVLFFGGNTTGAGDYNGIAFRSDNVLALEGYAASCARTTAVFRDPSAWYHIVFALDTTQATATDRLKIYVNGVSYSYTQLGEFPAQNGQLAINNSVPHNIGRAVDASGYFDGYIAEQNFVDGQALTPSSFGSTNASTGVWQPKKYAGTYGTNGFYLPFTDNSGATSTTIGKDFSGNSNNWTPNNISVTAGSTYDSMTDVPTLTSATASNFPTLNPLAVDSYATLSNANLTLTGNTSANSGGSIGTIGSASGKWYFEATVNSTTKSFIGVVTSYGNNTASLRDENNLYGASGGYNKGIGIRGSGTTYGNAAEKQTISSFTFATTDVIGVAIDADNGAVYFSVNGSWLNSGSPTSGSSRTGSFHNWTPSSDRVCYSAISAFDGGVTNLNHGQRPFSYTPPTGFVALNTFNLPTPTIGATASTQANKYFDATLYTGNGSSQSIVNAGGFQPDLVFFKNRSATSSPIIQDSIRGTGKVLVSNSTSGDQNITDYITAFNSNGFSVGNGASGAIVDVNANTNAYVGWQWKANGGTGVTNTAGSITSTVSANTSAGFSVVTYTGTGANATVGHGLGVAPSMVIVKMRSAGGNNWQVYHSALGQNKILQLDLTASVDTVTNYWYNGMTSTVFGVNGSYSGINSNGATYVAYCFAEVAGYSKFGSYTGNGSTDGVFVYTGFKPRYLMIKGTGADTNWVIIDTARSPYNTTDDWLLANSSTAELTDFGFYVDALSNGFKLRGTNLNINSSGDSYIYMAFAENPFKYSLAR